MKKNKKPGKRKEDSNRLVLDDILNTNDPEIKQFMKDAMKEEMNKLNPALPAEGIEAMERVTEKVVIRMAWRFKDKLSPKMQQILAEQYPEPDAA